VLTPAGRDRATKGAHQQFSLPNPHLIVCVTQRRANPFKYCCGREDLDPAVSLPRSRVIGRGGMGDIYRATDSVLGRVVAIKILAERFADDIRPRALYRKRCRRGLLTLSRSTTSARTTTVRSSSWST
jgi:hypothetical protein